MNLEVANSLDPWAKYQTFLWLSCWMQIMRIEEPQVFGKQFTGGRWWQFSRHPVAKCVGLNGKLGQRQATGADLRVSILGQLDFRSISSPAPELVLVTVPAGMKAVLSYLSPSCSSKPQAGHMRGGLLPRGDCPQELLGCVDRAGTKKQCALLMSTTELNQDTVHQIETTQYMYS